MSRARVLLSTMLTIDCEQQQLQSAYEGRVEHYDGLPRLLYTELTEDGERVFVTVTPYENGVHVKRRGAVNADFAFLPGLSSPVRYTASVGTLELELSTSHAAFKNTERGHLVELEYSLGFGGDTNLYRMTIEIICD